MKIYLAGPMAKGLEPGGETLDGRTLHAPWRLALETNNPNDAHWLVPEAIGCDHNGIWPEETVRGDKELIDQSDLVMAYIDTRERWGTLFEIGYATGRGIPVLLAVRSDAHIPTPEQIAADAVPEDQYPDMFNDSVAKSGHACNCMVQGDIGGYLWFPMAGVADYRVVDSEAEAVNALRLMFMNYKAVVRG